MAKEHVVAVVRLPAAPLLEHDLSGWTGEIRLGSEVGLGMLPRWSTPDRPLRPPKLPFRGASALPKSINWGYRVNPGSDDPIHDELALGAVQAVFESAHSSADAAAKLMKAEGEAWASRLTEWIEVYTRQDLHPTEPFVSMHEVGERIEVLFQREGGWKRGRAQSWRLTAVEWRPLSDDEWSRSVDAANDAVEPPLAHRLLRDARHEIHLDRLREATLLLASALEVALRPVVEWHLLIGGKTVPARTTLGQLTEAARKMGKLVPLLPRLAAPSSKPGFLSRRNGATHGAVVPVRDEVLADSAEVHATVNAIFPLL